MNAADVLFLTSLQENRSVVKESLASEADYTRLVEPILKLCQEAAEASPAPRIQVARKILEMTLARQPEVWRVGVVMAGLCEYVEGR